LVKKQINFLHSQKWDASPILLLLIIVLTGGGIFFIVMMLTDDPIEKALAADQVINALFIIEGKNNKPLSSFVLMYYPETKRAAIFDIPGEVGLILKGIGRVDRIDTVYNSQKRGAYRDEVASLLGIDINFFIVFTMDALGKTVDLIEGVEVFIPSAVKEYDPPILFSSGISKLDGDKVLSYITYKLSQEDSVSVQLRRQRFFLAFIKKIGEQNEMLKQKTVAKIYHSLLKISMKEQEYERLFDEYAKINIDRVNIQSITGTLREVSGQILLVPSYNGNLIKDIVRQTLISLTRKSEGSLSERVYTVDVLNGTAANGLAGRTAELLRNFGYDVLSVGNTSQDYEKTLIIDRSDSQGIAENFGNVIR
jgi:anionic cell wall polymer biosynthesis LytR-Cps2A-Psr (LCP) family protein